MNKPSPSDFEVRPEVADLYEISFVLCGLLFCKHCGASPPENAEVRPCSDLAYYRTAELAYEQGWRPFAESEYAVLCSVCAAQQAVAVERPKTGGG